MREWGEISKTFILGSQTLNIAGLTVNRCLRAVFVLPAVSSPCIAKELPFGGSSFVIVLKTGVTCPCHIYPMVRRQSDVAIWPTRTNIREPNLPRFPIQWY